jgi:hypothetical protein
MTRIGTLIRAVHATDAFVSETMIGLFEYAHNSVSAGDLAIILQMKPDMGLLVGHGVRGATLVEILTTSGTKGWAYLFDFVPV